MATSQWLAMTSSSGAANSHSFSYVSLNSHPFNPFIPVCIKTSYKSPAVNWTGSSSELLYVSTTLPFAVSYDHLTSTHRVLLVKLTSPMPLIFPFVPMSYGGELGAGGSNYSLKENNGNGIQSQPCLFNFEGIFEDSLKEPAAIKTKIICSTQGNVQGTGNFEYLMLMQLPNYLKVLSIQISIENESYSEIGAKTNYQMGNAFFKHECSSYFFKVSSVKKVEVIPDVIGIFTTKDLPTNLCCEFSSGRTESALIDILAPLSVTPPNAGFVMPCSRTSLSTSTSA